MKAGEAITRLLGRYGVKHVFGIPGTHSLELYRGLANEKHGVRHVLAHHEQGAGFMADGYARATGRPGVCYVITGAGVTNITTPMGEAYSDSVPVLVISPVNPPDGGGYNRGRLHEITDQAAYLFDTDCLLVLRRLYPAQIGVFRAFGRMHRQRRLRADSEPLARNPGCRRAFPDTDAPGQQHRVRQPIVRDSIAPGLSEFNVPSNFHKTISYGYFLM